MKSILHVGVTLALAFGMLSHLAEAQTVTTTIPDPCPYCGISSSGMVIDPGTDQILVAGGGSNSYVWVDGTKNTSYQSYIYSGASTNGGVAVNPATHKFYELISIVGYSPRLLVFNSSTGNFSSVTVSGASYSYLAVNPNTNTIYVSGNSGLLVINGATNTITTTITLPSASYNLAVNPATNKVYVSDGVGNVTVIDGASNTVVATVAVGVGPFAIAVNPVTNRIYVANRTNNPNYTPASVSVIDGATNTVAATINDPNALYPSELAVNPVTNMVYMTNNSSGTVSVINGATNTLVTSITAGSSPRAMAIDSINNRIYVAIQSSSNNVMVIDGTTNNTVTLTLGFVPGPLALDPVTNKIYAASFSGGKVAVIDGATNNATTVTDSSATNPIQVAVNPATGQIYVANSGSGNLTVINGATNSVATTVGAGSRPSAVGVNPLTNTIYVANGDSNNVTVVDGATNSTTTITDPKAKNPNWVAVNPVTNTIYVTNANSQNVTVINGAANTVTTTVTDPNASSGLLRGVAANPVTNQIYVANGSSNNVTVIDGVTNLPTTITDSTASYPLAVAVNPVTNMIYVINQASDNLTVINGTALSATLSLLTGQQPSTIAVNPISNEIYVGYSTTGSITVINAAKSNLITTITNAGASNSTGMAINPNTNKIYVTDGTKDIVTVIDGATNSFTTVNSTGTDPNSVDVDPVTGTIYVSNWNSSNVTVITEQRVSTIPLQASIAPVTGNLTGLTPTFTFSASSGFTPTASTPDNILFAVDTWQGPWQAATLQSGTTYSGSPGTLQTGFHILYAYATDGQEATSAQTSDLQFLMSNITAYGFLAAVAPVTVPTVTTASAVSITQTTATGGGSVTSDGGANVSGRGVCWSTSANPTTSGSCANTGEGTGAFTVSITGLIANTLYHVRAYAQNSSGTGYGSDLTFTTLTAGVPVINWSVTSPITYGAALGSSDLAATVINNSTDISADGTFAYYVTSVGGTTATASTILPGGSQQLCVQWTPSLSYTSQYNSASECVPITVNPASTTISWSPASPIISPATLGSGQFNASASAGSTNVSSNGTFTYYVGVVGGTVADSGTVLPVGSDQLCVMWSPSSSYSADYNSSQACANVTVNGPTIINWTPASPITYPATLGSGQFNAAASSNATNIGADGTFTYYVGSVGGTMATSGTVLQGGADTLCVQWTPASNYSSQYSSASLCMPITVNAASTAISWSPPATTIIASTRADRGSIRRHCVCRLDQRHCHTAR